MNEEFQALLAGPEADIDLLRAALLIAQAHYSDLDVGEWMQHFGELVERARARVGAEQPGSLAALMALQRFMTVEAGFRGDQVDYYDPRNSYLNDVLERRLGIPISLSLVFLELGRRLGLDTFGIGFPGRFLAGCRVPEGVKVFDSFDGREVDEAHCREILREIYGAKLSYRAEMLQPAGARQILARTLSNLQAVYIQRRDVEQALRFTELTVLVEPAAALPYRNRGLLYFEAEDYGSAIRDLEEYLRREPQAADASIVQKHLTKARARSAPWN